MIAEAISYRSFYAKIYKMLEIQELFYPAWPLGVALNLLFINQMTVFWLYIFNHLKGLIPLLLFLTQILSGEVKVCSTWFRYRYTDL